MSTKISTSIEQSEKLLSLGLDPRTADMFYATEFGILIAKPPHEVKGHEPCIPFTPAWSLTALLELMPNSIGDSNKNVGWFDDTWWCAYMDEDSCINQGTSASNPLDVVFKMVCWLIEQGHIKVKK